MFARVARASFVDNICFNVLHVVPLALQGVFRKRPFWVRMIAQLHPDPLGRRFVRRLCEKYRSWSIDLRMMTRRTRLILEPEAIREVLERSPEVYADPPSKRKGMSVFQPNAVTISQLPQWPARRAFNEAVLSAGLRSPLDEHFLAVVRDEIGQWHNRNPARLAWKDLQDIFDRITLRIVFGDSARGDFAVLAALDELMDGASRVLFPRRSAKAFAALYAAIRKYMDFADPKSLVGVACSAPNSPEVRPENQIPHWLFALKDTLAANTTFAIALMASHGVQTRLALESLPAEPKADDIHSATVLEGCVQEAMRLWPTTPFLMRQLTAATTIGGHVLEAGAQVVIWNSANHRNPAAVPNADHFEPGRWAHAPNNWFNHLSNGRQVCAGKNLALFVAKAFLGHLFGQFSVEVRNPAMPSDSGIPESFDWFSFIAQVRPKSN